MGNCPGSFEDCWQDRLGRPGPIWGPSDFQVVEVTDQGLRVRFPDGTEIVLQGSPDEVAGLLGQVAPAAGEDGGQAAESNGSSGAFNAYLDDGFGGVFSVTADGAVVSLPDVVPGDLIGPDSNLPLLLAATATTSSTAKAGTTSLAAVTTTTGSGSDVFQVSVSADIGNNSAPT